MTRFGRNRKIVSILLTVGWLTVTASPVLANMRFYTIVQQVCRSYRVPVALDQMTLDGAETESAQFHLVLQSRRNNFEEVMLVGYIATGQAIARSGVPVKTIMITITIPKADNMMLTTSANVDLLEQFRLGNLKSSEFMRQLQWN